MEEAMINLDAYPFFTLTEDETHFHIVPWGYDIKKLDAPTLALYKQKRNSFLASSTKSRYLGKINTKEISDDTEAELLAYFVAKQMPKVHMWKTIDYLKSWSDLNILASQEKINCIDITLLFAQLAHEILHLKGEALFSSVHTYFKMQSSGNIIDLGWNAGNKKRLFTPTEHSQVMLDNGKRPFVYMIKKTQRALAQLLRW